MMNLIHLEGQMEAIRVLKNSKTQKIHKNYRFVTVGINQKITQVSKNHSREELLQSWFEQ